MLDNVREMATKKNLRNRQDSILRSHRKSDFELDALTTRPRLLLDINCCLTKQRMAVLKVSGNCDRKQNVQIS